MGESRFPVPPRPWQERDPPLRDCDENVIIYVNSRKGLVMNMEKEIYIDPSYSRGGGGQTGP